MKTLQIQELTVAYPKRVILDHITMTADAGEILVLLGENGSGKTTFLKAMQGSVPIFSGQIAIHATDLSTLSIRDRAKLVTTMPQEPPATPGITGLAQIEMGFYPQKGIWGKLTAEEYHTIYAMAKSFGVDSLLPRELSAMSTGERQTISLLRAAMQDTPVLLLDEPASALDFNRKEALFVMLHTLAEAGKTILMVLHDPTDALRHGSRIFKLEKTQTGSRLQELPPKTDLAAMEAALQSLYPGLTIHKDPLCCILHAPFSRLEPTSSAH